MIRMMFTFVYKMVESLVYSLCTLLNCWYVDDGIICSAVSLVTPFLSIRV